MLRTPTLVDAIAGDHERRQIQVLRGLACILVVLMHTIGLRPVGGMRVADDSVWRDITELLRHFQMPLFSFLSGFVYAYRPVRGEYVRRFLGKKAARLLIPMSVVAMLYFVSEHLVPNTLAPPAPLHEAWKIFVLPYKHLWFLQAIFIIFVLVAALDSLRVLDRGRDLLIALAVAIVLRLVTPFDTDVFDITGHIRAIDVFSFNGAMALLPFFLLGLGLNRYRAHVQWTGFVWIATVVFALSMGMHWLGVLEIVGQPVQKGSLFATVIGITGVLFLFQWVPFVPILERLGNASFAIYAYHVFFVAGSRAALHLLGVSADITIFAVGLSCGVVGPLLADSLIRPLTVGRRVLLGDS